MSKEYDACLVEQPTIPANADVDELPKQILRKCCPYKSCGNTDLYLAAEYDRHTGTRIYGFRRGSNDDWYFGPYTVLADLIEAMNRREQWPVDAEKLDALFERHAQGVYPEND